MEPARHPREGGGPAQPSSLIMGTAGTKASFPRRREFRRRHDRTPAFAGVAEQGHRATARGPQGRQRRRVGAADEAICGLNGPFKGCLERTNRQAYLRPLERGAMTHEGGLPGNGGNHLRRQERDASLRLIISLSTSAVELGHMTLILSANSLVFLLAGQSLRPWIAR